MCVGRVLDVCWTWLDVCWTCVGCVLDVCWMCVGRVRITWAVCERLQDAGGPPFLQGVLGSRGPEQLQHAAQVGPGGVGGVGLWEHKRGRVLRLGDNGLYDTVTPKLESQHSRRGPRIAV